MAKAVQLRHLPGLGPASEAMLVQAGIDAPDALRDAGAVGAFLAVERAIGRPSLNLLYALAGAIEGRPWSTVARQDRERLLMELEDRRDLARGHRGLQKNG